MFFRQAAGNIYIYRGDPASYDWTIGDFVKDDAYHDLDLSSIIPVGTKLVHLHCIGRCDTVGAHIQFRKNGQSNGINNAVLNMQGANITIAADLFVQPDADRKIEYDIFADTWAIINLVVRGWLV